MKSTELLNQREIKFRAWDGNNSEMIYPESKHNEDTNNHFTMDAWCDSQFGKCVTMQFTGLKDRKGKEIYEGDIVEYITSGLTGKKCENTGYVIYKDDGFTIENVFGIKDSFLSRTEEHEIEVIGNIFENPELI